MSCEGIERYAKMVDPMIGAAGLHNGIGDLAGSPVSGSLSCRSPLIPGWYQNGFGGILHGTKFVNNVLIHKLLGINPPGNLYPTPEAFDYCRLNNCLLLHGCLRYIAF